MEGRSVITAIEVIIVLAVVLAGLGWLRSGTRRELRALHDSMDEAYHIPEVHYARDGIVNLDRCRANDVASVHQARPPETFRNLLLTPRQLERANIQRRLQGKPPLTRAGFLEAANNCPTYNRNSADWIAWFSRFNAREPSHMQLRSAVDGGALSVTIRPD
jgi:hypothetical protein